MLQCSSQSSGPWLWDWGPLIYNVYYPCARWLRTRASGTQAVFKSCMPPLKLYRITRWKSCNEKFMAKGSDIKVETRKCYVVRK